MVGPFVWCVGAIDSQICFYFLVGSFYSSIRLGVISCGHSRVDVELFA